MRSLFEIINSFLLKVQVTQKYYNRFGKILNWKNPQKYTEKIQIYKISPEIEKLSIYTDKIEVQKYISKTIGAKYLNKIYGIYQNTDEIKPDDLPRQFVLKANHGSGWNIICKNKNKLDWNKTRQTLNDWLHQNYFYFNQEKQYQNIPPKIICEKYLTNHGKEPPDYKLFCFSGKVYFIEVDNNRFTNHTRNFYDTNWKKIPLVLEYPNGPKLDLKPKNFKNMLSLATKLSLPFKHVRVDFYNLNGQIIFSELTFTHGSGFGRFFDKKYDLLFGKLFSL
jgi:hypothetical protein